jgi:hypothetical protein
MVDVVEVTVLEDGTSEIFERPYTPDEAAQRASAAAAATAQASILATLHTNRETLEQQAQAALAQNKIAIAADPAAVTLAQVAGQVQALSAQNNALIRLVLGLLDDVT